MAADKNLNLKEKAQDGEAENIRIKVKTYDNIQVVFNVRLFCVCVCGLKLMHFKTTALR